MCVMVMASFTTIVNKIVTIHRTAPGGRARQVFTPLMSALCTVIVPDKPMTECQFACGTMLVWHHKLLRWQRLQRTFVWKSRGVGISGKFTVIVSRNAKKQPTHIGFQKKNVMGVIRNAPWSVVSRRLQAKSVYVFAVGSLYYDSLASECGGGVVRQQFTFSNRGTTTQTVII